MKKKRMYSIVLSRLSGLHKGIQAAHAIVEYANKHKNDKSYKKWAEEDKTLILLETGTSDVLNKSVKRLKALDVKVEEFQEPDLYNIMTAVAFLVDEEIWNLQKYGETEDCKILGVRSILKNFNLASN